MLSLSLLERRPLRRLFLMTKPPNDVERIEGLEAENERLRAAIGDAEEAIEQQKANGHGSIEFDGTLARLRNALGP